ncbi:MAG: hypothetical protein ACI392_07570 [Paludibacteraceae bacterium]
MKRIFVKSNISKIVMLQVTVLLAVTMAACHKKETITRYDNPQWAFTDTVSYTYIGATAVISLPDNLQPYIDADDQMAVFVDNVCRGVANLDLENGLFNISIPLADANEEPTAYIRYWSSRTGYIYQSETFVITSGSIIGTTAQPHQIILTVL